MRHVQIKGRSLPVLCIVIFSFKQILMSVSMVRTTVTPTLIAQTFLDHSHVLAMMGILEMEPLAMVRFIIFNVSM